MNTSLLHRTPETSSVAQEAYAKGSRTISWFVVVFLSWEILPTAYNLYALGRGTASGSGAISSVGTTSVGYFLELFLLLLFSTIGITIVLKCIKTFRISILAALGLLLLSLAVVLYGLATSGDTSIARWLPGYFTVIIVLLSGPTPVLLRTMAKYGLVLSIASILMGVVSPDVALMNSWDYGQNKSIITTDPLAGPFTHSNKLGLLVAVLAPFALAFRRHPTKVVSLIASVIVVTWSASRTAIAALLVAGILTVVLALIRRSGFRVISYSRALLYMSLLLCICVPVLGWSSGFLAGRGAIWDAAIYSWSASPWIGEPNTFRGGSATQAIGYASTHAHNIFYTDLAIAGLVGLLLFFSLFIPLIEIAARSSSWSLTPVASVITILVAGSFDVTLSMTSPSSTDATMWAIVAAILACRSRTQDDEVSSSARFASRHC